MHNNVSLWLTQVNNFPVKDILFNALDQDALAVGAENRHFKP
jgi:hypothetical protein